MVFLCVAVLRGIAVVGYVASLVLVAPECGTLGTRASVSYARVLTTLPSGVGGLGFPGAVLAHGVMDAKSCPALPLPVQMICFGRSADPHVRHEACDHLLPVVRVGHGAWGGRAALRGVGK